jgi:hypothetical protein
VTEEVTPKAPPPEKPMGWPPNFAEIAAKSQFSIEPEIREMYFLGGTPTLRIDLESVRVHLVQGVEFATEEHSCVAGDGKIQLPTRPTSEGFHPVRRAGADGRDPDVS